MPRLAKVVTSETLAGAFVALLARDLSPAQLAKAVEAFGPEVAA